MKTRMKLVGTSGAIAVALLALSFSIGSSTAVRADDTESFAVPVQDTVLVPLKDLKALEQRLAYLEGAVTALTVAWEHIDKHRMCVSDDSGAETCINKAQLDAILVGQSHGQASHTTEIVSEARVIPVAEPLTVEALQKDQEPEETGTLALTNSGADVNIGPDRETSTASGIATVDDAETAARSLSAEVSQDQGPAQPGPAASAHPTELNIVPDNESSVAGDLP
jgi:hypothetical protein